MYFSDTKHDRINSELGSKILEKRGFKFPSSRFSKRSRNIWTPDFIHPQENLTLRTINILLDATEPLQRNFLTFLCERYAAWNWRSAAKPLAFHMMLKIFRTQKPKARRSHDPLTYCIFLSPIFVLCVTLSIAMQ